MRLRFHSTASRHRVSRARSAYVVEHCGLPFDAVVGEGVVLYLGDDWNGIPLEVGALEDGDELIVIHAMKLRPKFKELYEEALPWRK